MEAQQSASKAYIEEHEYGEYRKDSILGTEVAVCESILVQPYRLEALNRHKGTT